MSTIRRGSRPSDNLTIIANGFLRDRRVSLAARGLGAQLLGHRDGWEITTAGLAKTEGIGRDKLRGYMRELEDAGYLLRERERLPGGRLGEMLYEIHDTPQPQEKPRPDLRLDAQGLAGQGLGSGQHKKTTSKKTTSPEEKEPSGGQTAAAAAPSLELSPIHDQPQEDPMAPADTIALFDVPATKKRRDEGRSESPSAKTVTAAFVDSYRSHHSGADPTKSTIGRVARDSKAILDRGDASPEELAQAVKAMGEGPYSNVSVALSIHRQDGQKRRGFTAGTPARVHTHPIQMAAAERVREEEYQQLMADDDLVRWVSQDSAVMADWVARYPELEQRFRDVA